MALRSLQSSTPSEGEHNEDKLSDVKYDAYQLKRTSEILSRCVFRMVHAFGREDINCGGKVKCVEMCTVVLFCIPECSK